MKRKIGVFFVVSFLLILLASIEASAQQVSSFEQLQVLVKPGDKIYVTDFDGKTTDGRIAELSASSLGLIVDKVRHDWLQKDVREIKQWRGDPLGNGALIGAAIGGGGTAVVFAAYCRDGGCESGGGVIAAYIALYAGIGAAVGVGIDALIPSKQTIFLNKDQKSAGRLHFRPILNRTAKGVNVAFSF